METASMKKADQVARKILDIAQSAQPRPERIRRIASVLVGRDLEVRQEEREAFLRASEESKKR
jgi:hypothetical protein